MMTSTLDPNARRGQAGFTLVEALVAVTVLIFGLMAVTNLLLVAASSNTVANQGSAATTSASQVMDVLRSTPWNELVPGGDVANSARRRPGQRHDQPVAGLPGAADPDHGHLQLRRQHPGGRGDQDAVARHGGVR